ncbi:MAG: class A beta-lactamase-related serine hydrolase [Gammaproteobacteria bacterium TMED163]|nr:MAG: class A beta-lactamase-related serine hydrolase [Gammaproteobacteria bacterium TMED163]
MKNLRPAEIRIGDRKVSMVNSGKAFSIALALTASSSYAQLMEIAAPESVGFYSAGLEAVTANLQEHVNNRDIAGVVAAVARDGKIVYYEALGMMDIEQVTPMREDALFRIYSMTREITSVAVLQLYEQGKFEMDEPIQKYLPEFSTQRVLMDSESTDVSQTRERVGDITVAKLLTHTSGLGSRSSSLYREQRVRDKNYTLDEMVEKAASVPLFHNPGTEFRYGIHATILGKLIEVWSGVPLNEYLQEQIFEPLAMGNTMFWADGENANRVAELYRPTDGRLLPYQIETVPWTMRPRLMEGGVGLLSSVMDFMHFSQMVLNKGELGGNRILKEETAELMYQNAVPDQAMPIGDRGYWVGSGWTLGGFNLVMNPGTYSYPVSEGTIWWDGSAGTRYFIDPVQNTVTVIMAQVSPSRGGGFREDFTRLVDAAMVERR